MEYRGRIQKGVVVFDGELKLPEGAEVAVRVVQPAKTDEQTRPSIWDKLLELAGTVEGLPPDMAENHDHYLHGTPKKKK